MIACLIILSVLYAGLSAGEPIGKVEIVRGKVEVIRSADKQTMTVKDSAYLYDEDQVRTGEDSSVRVFLKNDTTAYLSPQSLVTVVEEKGKPAIRFIKGEKSTITSLWKGFWKFLEERADRRKKYLGTLSTRGTLGTRGTADSPTPISPLRGRIRSDRPGFEWEEIQGAASYRIKVTDDRGQVVFSKEVSGTSLTSPVNLNRGKRYHWLVEALIADEIKPSEKVDFEVISTREEKDIKSKAKHILAKVGEGGDAHFYLGAFLEDQGLFQEADKEYTEAAKRDPSNALFKRYSMGLMVRYTRGEE